jgi:hypothetical protein
MVMLTSPTKTSFSIKQKITYKWRYERGMDMGFIVREAVPQDASAIATIDVLLWQAAYQNIIPAEYLSRLNIEKRAERYANDFVVYKGITHYLGGKDKYVMDFDCPDGVVRFGLEAFKKKI